MGRVTQTSARTPAAPASRRFVDPGRGLRVPPVVLVLLGLIAVAVSMAGAWIPSFWGDEAASILSAERPWPSLAEMLGRVDAVHGLYYAFLHLWIDVFGASPVSVRLPSAIGIGLATAGIAELGARLAGRRVGIVAAVVLMTLPRATYYGIETRAYAFTMVTATWLILILLLLVERRERRIWPWVLFGLGFAVSTVLFIYTLLFAVIFAVLVLLARPGAAVVLRAAIAVAAGGLLASPVVLLSASQREQIQFLHSRNGLDAADLFQSPWFTDLVPALVGWGCILVGIVIALVRRDRRAIIVGLVWVIVPSLLLALATPITPLYSSRYLAFTAPAIALLMAVGIVGLASLLTRRVWLVAVITALVVAASVPTYLHQRTAHPRNGGVDWNSIAATVGDGAQPGDAIIFDPTPINARQPRLAMYVYPEDFTGLEDIGLREAHQDTDWLWDTVLTRDEIVARAAGFEQVWLVTVDPRISRDPEESARYLTDLEAEGFRVVAETPGHRSTVYQLRRD